MGSRKKDYYSGILLTLLASPIVIAGAALASPAIIIVGGVVSLAGGITMIASHSSIGTAGKILKEKGI